MCFQFIPEFPAPSSASPSVNATKQSDCQEGEQGIVSRSALLLHEGSEIEGFFQSTTQNLLINSEPWTAVPHFGVGGVGGRRIRFVSPSYVIDLHILWYSRMVTVCSHAMQ